jgi:hypothetical protein
MLHHGLSRCVQKREGGCPRYAFCALRASVISYSRDGKVSFCGVFYGPVSIASNGRMVRKCKNINPLGIYSRAPVSADSVSAAQKKKNGKLINKRSISFKPRPKRERAVTW